ncbi:DUF378 domain-containing protein [Candidatus Microgenomates bacterium]|nr:DUF378 domain-containing protein [Candidatus Microgenomates bacterium]
MDLGTLAWWLLVVGALNWGLVGLLNLNVVELILGSWPVIVRIVYILVGLSGVYYLVNMPSGKRKK